MLYKLANPYHSQRNNRIDPAGTCQVTAAIMALRASGIPFSFPEDQQPEDYLAILLNGPEAREKLEREYPSLRSRPPREIHAILSWAINEKLAKRRVTIFTTAASIQELLFRVSHRNAASLVSGRFTKSGHVVTLVGFESSQPDLEKVGNPGSIDLASVERIIVDDPWGDQTTGYQDPDGNDVSYTVAEFNDLTKSYGVQHKKWAHLFDSEGIF